MLVFVSFKQEKQLLEDFCSLMNWCIYPRRRFQCNNQFFTTHDIKWEKCIGIITDGVTSMSDYKTGFWEEWALLLHILSEIIVAFIDIFSLLLKCEKHLGHLLPIFYKLSYSKRIIRIFHKKYQDELGKKYPIIWGF